MCKILTRVFVLFVGRFLSPTSIMFRACKLSNRSFATCDCGLIVLRLPEDTLEGYRKWQLVHCFNCNGWYTDDFIPVISSLKQTATGVKSSFTTLPPIFCIYQFWQKINQIQNNILIVMPKNKNEKDFTVLIWCWRPWAEDSTIFLAPIRKVALAFFDVKKAIWFKCPPIIWKKDSILDIKDQSNLLFNCDSVCFIVFNTCPTLREFENNMEKSNKHRIKCLENERKKLEAPTH